MTATADLDPSVARRAARAYGRPARKGKAPAILEATPWLERAGIARAS